jgi:hypothetical protein
MHLLIPYVKLTDHVDPAFDEFTYGDVGRQARKLKSSLNKGDYVFFHTSSHGKKYITTYYVIDRALDIMDACRDGAIVAKYKNPHIVEYLASENARDGADDVIIFGDPIASRFLKRPLPFDRRLATRLSLEIEFPRTRSVTQAISSSTRAWRELSQRDVSILLTEIAAEEKRYRRYVLRSTEEVAETIEKDVEYFVANNPALIGRLIGKKLTRRDQQLPIGEGRLDVLFEDQKRNLVVVELKVGRIGRDALQQLRSYIRDLQKETNKDILGVIVCAGVMPAYEEELRKQKGIKILVYGWDLRIQDW